MSIITIPDELAARIEATGEDLNRFTLAALSEKLAAKEKEPKPRTFGDLLAEGWVPPTVTGKPRADGRAWSEIEAACDPE